MNIGGFEPKVPEQRGVKRSREGEGGEREAKRARIDIAGTLHAVHRLASLRTVQAQNHPELVSLIQTLARNLELIPQENVESLKQDITRIKNGLLGESSEKSGVVKEIDTLLRDVKQERKRPRDEEAFEEPEAKRVRKEVPSYLEELPGELRDEIASHLSRQEVFKLQAVSKGFFQQEAVKKARSEFADAIAKKAIDEAFQKGLPLSSLEKTLTDALKGSVFSLDVSSKAGITPDDLRALAKLFPNVCLLDLRATILDAAHLQALCNFTNVRSLGLSQTGLTNASIAYLADLTNLAQLDLSHNEQLDGSTFNLLPLSLRELDAMYCSITTLAGLSQHTDLVNLVLCGNKEIDKSTFGLLPSSIGSLNLYDCELTNASISCLAHLSSLYRLIVTHSLQLDGSTFNQLPSSIKYLEAICCSLTNANMIHFSKLTHLEMLDLTGNEQLDGSTFDTSLPLSLKKLLLSDHEHISRDIFLRLKSNRPHLTFRHPNAT